MGAISLRLREKNGTLQNDIRHHSREGVAQETQLSMQRKSAAPVDKLGLADAILLSLPFILQDPHPA